MTTPMPVLTVTQLNRHVRSWLEHEMGPIRVEGELSNLSKPASGHFYFTLKDPTAQLRCVYFRNRHSPLEANNLQNGQLVVAEGRLSLYEARGDYQLIVEQLSDAGQGDLYRQFELLKIKLAALGLFDAAHKKELPLYPSCIGIVTSATGAALRDILSTLARRFPIARVIVYACEVQGKQAAQQLIAAINQANNDHCCDVLILARGGGSIEDLWAFNDEQLAYTIAKSQLPIVSGVGHETDFTIADFVADFRAETPTAAAVAVTPNAADLMAFMQSMETQLLTAMERFIQNKQLLLHHEMQKITSPRRLISSYWQSLDYLNSHLHQAVHKILAQKQHLSDLTSTRLNAKNPIVLLKQAKVQLNQIENNLLQLIRMKIDQLKHQFTNQLTTLHAVSPLATLDRGYSIATKDNKILVDSAQADIGDLMRIRLAKGHLIGVITDKGE